MDRITQSEEALKKEPEKCLKQYRAGYYTNDELKRLRMLDELLHTPNAKEIYNAWKCGLM